MLRFALCSTCVCLLSLPVMAQEIGQNTSFRGLSRLTVEELQASSRSDTLQPVPAAAAQVPEPPAAVSQPAPAAPQPVQAAVQQAPQAPKPSPAPIQPAPVVSEPVQAAVQQAPRIDLQADASRQASIVQPAVPSSPRKVAIQPKPKRKTVAASRHHGLAFEAHWEPRYARGYVPSRRYAYQSDDHCH